MLFNIKFDVTVFDVPVFDVTYPPLSNLGLNNLKFGQEAISDGIDSIGLTQSDRIDYIDTIIRFIVFTTII